MLKLFFIILIFPTVFGCNMTSNAISEITSPSTESEQSTSLILEKAVKSIGCKIRKPDGGILYDSKFINWKKDEFKMISQTVITASYGMRIYFEEEVYANEQDAENRLSTFKKVSPEIEAKMNEMHRKIHTELDFREAFRRDENVYFVSVPGYGQWLDGDVKKYRQKLEKAIPAKANSTKKEMPSAEQKLREAGTFVVGENNKGYISSEEMAFREILSRQNPQSIFIELTENASPEGKLYGLLGLKILKCECFSRQLESVKKTINLVERINTPQNIPAGNVQIQNGCKMSYADSLEITQQIADGKYDRFLENKVDEKGKVIR